MAQENYQQLEEIYKELNAISASLSLMYWDSATLMPTESGEYRGNHVAALTSLHHKLATRDEIKELIAAAKQENLSEWQHANLREIEYNYTNKTIFDEKLVAALAKAANDTELVWRKAKKANDFSSVEPYLDSLINLVRQQAAVKSQYLGISKYEALVDMYDRGSKTSNIENIFDQLLEFLPGLIKNIQEKQQSKNLQPQLISLEVSKQKQICHRIATDLGFDFNRGRMDESMHPFCGGIHTDVRMTTNFNPDNALLGIMGVVHETGHALYEQGLPKKFTNQPVGNAMGMTWHESQSLTYEMQLGSSQFFIEYLGKLLKDIGGLNISYEQLWINLNYVTPSMIRIMADEVTYPLHIILRFKLEKLIIEENLPTKEIPQIWNKLMQQYLGIIPGSDQLGCLQDIHWHIGSFGYFPSYSLGAIKAAQLFNQYKATVKEISFDSLKEWLNKNIHSQGSLYTSDELMKKASGENLNVKYYKQYLTAKYLD